MDEMLVYLAAIFSKESLLPTSTYMVKKVVCPLGLDIQKFHACSKNCINYRKEYEALHKCAVCNTSRYKGATNQDDDEDAVMSYASVKVV